MISLTKNRKNIRAIGLVEILIATALLAFLISGGYSIFTNFSKRTTETDIKNSIMKDVRTLITHIKKDVEACYGTDSALTGPPIPTAQSDSVQWTFTDPDGNQTTVSYSRAANGDVTRTAGTRSKVMARNIKTMEITATGDADDLAKSTIKIVIEAEVNRSGFPEPIKYSQRNVAVIQDLSSKAQNKSWKRVTNP
ncbi:MAG: hypothetical protein CVV64_04075 [Candidatus Wallbacteria bacterium HGW-Wallbacteria-1]|jgi:type II secretory pathway pseudopilin PulG|uniref:Uncharacterized protein n=1 Tax=Candidatus Wallbacteria bacterium HGW-Wallbacteria-1 TaxID=2013854 RepID=A0A2N1PRI5_9BACT|nr:MAG: hypothetical protein CVV64_04075 [Candidatus Wallbacteria bacterium HGW-Wallbacteria-1]